jgi:hypothetical protein
MRYSELKQLITTQWLHGSAKDMFMVTSSPGIGKSAMAHEIGADPALKFDRVIEINPSLLDTPDLAGLALIGDKDSDVLKFKKPPLLAPAQTGRNLVIWEEAPDAPMGMQNLVARWAYDCEVNGMSLSPDTYHIMLGNKSTDRSGAGRVSTKLVGRVTDLEMDANLDDFVDYCMNRGVEPVDIQFIRYRANLLVDWDSNRRVNAMPRTWIRAFRTVKQLPHELQFAKMSGDVGPGPAAELVAFRKIFASLVAFEDVVMNPTGTPVPEDLSAQYAIVGSLSHNTDVGNIDRVSQYVDRLPPDFGVMFWMDAKKKTPALKGTKPFIKWAVANQNVVMN